MNFLSPIVITVMFLLISIFPNQAQIPNVDSDEVLERRHAYLDQILEWLPEDRPGFGRVSYLDSTFNDWLDRTGELPPDFDQMVSIPHLPDPLMIDEGSRDIPVRNAEQWEEKKEWMKEQLQHYITGTFPPPPDNLEAEILSEKMDGEMKLIRVELRFGPEQEARLNLELMIPPGTGPFPVFMTQWNHREWAQIAVRRGYIGCVYAGADSRDDTEDYGRIWAGEYDFTRLMRRAYGSFRAIDYLYTLPEVDRGKIAITGHSRNGKQSLMAAAFDERITAVVPSSGGTGAEVPWRYCAYQYDVEDIALLGPAQPSWLHPRLRFFAGREDKLPVDQNHFMALIAPRGLMLSTAIEEGASNPWGIEKAYLSAQTVFDFHGKKENVALRFRRGRHSTDAEEIEAYIDFFDYVFGRSSKKPEYEWKYVSSFAEWQEKSGASISVEDFPIRSDESMVNFDGKNISDLDQWENRKTDLVKNLRWMLGEEPAGVSNPGPKRIRPGLVGEEKFGSVIPRPGSNSVMERMAISPYSGFGDYLYGYLYYPKERKNEEKMPVVIYLHEYDYSKGFSSMGFHHHIAGYFEDLVRLGFAVFAYDMIGFGNRQEEGRNFYDRYPRWSRMGKMTADVSGAVDALSQLDGIDADQIYVFGYSLGGTVGLYATALDDRIRGLISVAGFTPMREGEEGAWHMDEIANQHLLMPRAGYFSRERDRLPLDYEEILALIAPRSVLIISPNYDALSSTEKIQQAVEQSNEIFRLYGPEKGVDLYVPNDYNRFSQPMREETLDWLENQVGWDR